ncbi:hypothetical protein [Flavonifractor sp. An306]|uniref:hypothetical protein n=1 Tax=Flavonifractor sp. An306 TaxID=1965629 RepID=UPI0013A5F341|nr:hypothetical protein [Flavonifractor sp. An306]
MSKVAKGIAVLGVGLLGFGLYTDDNLWAFLVGLLLIIGCALSGKQMRTFLGGLLDWL